MQARRVPPSCYIRSGGIRFMQSCLVFSLQQIHHEGAQPSSTRTRSSLSCFLGRCRPPESKGSFHRCDRRKRHFDVSGAEKNAHRQDQALNRRRGDQQHGTAPTENGMALHDIAQAAYQITKSNFSALRHNQAPAAWHGMLARRGTAHQIARTLGQFTTEQSGLARHKRPPDCQNAYHCTTTRHQRHHGTARHRISGQRGFCMAQHGTAPAAH